MTVIKIQGRQVDVDIEGELRLFPWERDRWTADKLIACSPFRTDSHPSFFVSLETGGWGDSGGMGEFESGRLNDLLGYLRGTSPEEADEYLIDKYGVLYDLMDDSEPIRLKTPELRLNRSERKEIAGEPVVQAVSPYMSKRGISDSVQRMFGVGYGEGHVGFTAIPWHTVDGRLANVKYRSTRDKRFFYESKATPVTTLVYGLDQARRFDSVVITEGEIDALSWWTAGIPAIALGGSHMSDDQTEAIIREGFSEVYLGGDNDKQGRKLNRLAADKLRGFTRLLEVDYGDEKDANDVILRHGADRLSELLDESEAVKLFHLRR